MKLLDFLLSHFWYTEVIGRRLAYINPAVNKWLNKQLSLGRYKPKKHDIIPGLGDNIHKYIKSLGINRGDILIVHSSMDGLRPTGFPPKMIINMLLELVGEEGTLVFPAFPILDLVDKNNIPIYDPTKTLCWTGLLPNIYCRNFKPLRSSFPNNSLAAKGPHAYEMMKDNLIGTHPHGKDSAWAYCASHHAKILYLGVKANHCLTIMHVAEELMEDNWPIKDWYENKRYNVKIQEQITEITTSERRLFWARFLRENYASLNLKKKGLLIQTQIQGVPIDYIPDSGNVVDYVIRNAQNGNLIFWLIPKKYLK